MMGRLAVSFPPGAGGLTAEQVDHFLAAVDVSKMSDGRISPAADRRVDPSIRSSGVQWIGVEEAGQAFFSHLFTLASVANRERGWDFVLAGMAAKIQATRYAALGMQHYTWHMDWGPGPTRNRKITAVVHLSDPAGYSGGRLQLTNGRVPVVADHAPGTVTVFPSFIMHRVTPMSVGVRFSAVAWVLGPPFA